MMDIAVNVLVLTAAVFMLLAALGITRMPDVYLRLSSVTKSSTMGAGLLLLAVVLEDASVGTVIKALMVAVFGFLTSPISAHLLSRAAHSHGVPLWAGSIRDDLKAARTREADEPALQE